MNAMDEQSVVAAALDLPAGSRVALAERLWLSVDDSHQEDVAQAWAEELEQRLLAVEAGMSQPIPGEQAIAELVAKYSRNRS